MTTDRQTPAGTPKTNDDTAGAQTETNPFNLQVFVFPPSSALIGTNIADEDARNNAAQNITSYVTGMELKLGLTRPWDTLSLKLAVPRTYGVINRNILTDARRVPAPGDWIVVKSYQSKSFAINSRTAAVFFGYCTDVSPEAVVAGTAKDYRRISVQATSWLDILGRNQVYVAPQAGTSVGTFFARRRQLSEDPFILAGEKRVRLASRTWDELIEAMTSALQGGEFSEGPTRSTGERGTQSDALGKSLAKAWRSLAMIRVSPLLASLQVFAPDGSRSIARGSFLADQVPVVYNIPTRDRYAPRLTIDPVPGWSLQGLKSIYPQGQNTLSILEGTYLADVNMVEFFPSLEPYDQARPVESDVDGLTSEAADDFQKRQIDADTEDRIRRATENQVVPGLGGALAALNKALGPITQGFKESVRNFESDEKKRGRLGKPASELAQSLGVNPVLVYRVKPWRAESIQDFVKNDTAPIVTTSRAKLPVDDKIFQGVTWNVRADDFSDPDNLANPIIHGFHYSADEITSWTGRFSEADHVNCVSVGLPGQPNSAIQFLEEAGLPLMAENAIEEAGLRYFNPQWPFWPPFDQRDKDQKRGILSSLYTVALQALQFMGNADRFFKGSLSLAKFSPELRPGMTVEFDTSDVFDPQTPVMTAYVESVRHSVTVDPKTGKINSSTVVEYSRGAVDAERYTTYFKKQ